MKLFGFDITRRKKSDAVSHVIEELVVQVGKSLKLTPEFTNIGKDLMDSSTYSQAIRTNARYCSRVQFSAVRINKEDGEQIHDFKAMDKLLQLRPNPLQTAIDFWERVATYYYAYNNAFIYLQRDNQDNIVAMWAIPPDSITYSDIIDGDIWMKFSLNGKRVTYPYSLMVHIKSNVLKDPLYGIQNESVRTVLNLINTNYKGIENAIRTSAYIRFIGELSTKLNDERLEEMSKKFTKQYLSVNSSSDPIAILFSDSTYKLTPVQTNGQKTANYAEMKQFDEAVYKYLGCPEAIINGTASDDVKTSYIETTVMDFGERASQELTYKIYTPGEYDRGNRIIASDNRIQSMSMATRLQMFDKVRELGAFTFGVLGDLIGLPVPGNIRNKVVPSQNYKDGYTINNDDDKTKTGQTDDSGSGQENTPVATTEQKEN